MSGSAKYHTRSIRASKSRFLDSAKKKNGKFNKAIKAGNPAYRLFKELSYPFEPCHYSLHHHHLKIDKKMAASKYLYDHLVIKAWKIRIRQFIEPPYFFKFEVGDEDENGNLGNLHVHLITDVDAGLLWIPRSAKSRIIKPITDPADFRRRLIYLYKPAARKSEKAKTEYFEALSRILEENTRLPKSKQRKQPPQISGYVWE
jgi:hypothetical protein